jgi:hypothetical protein
VVEDLAVPVAIAGAGLRQKIRGVGHGLEAAGEYRTSAAGADLVGGQHDCLHARAAHLVDRGCRHSEWYAGKEGGLPCGSLPESRRHHATEDYLVDSALGEACVGQRRRGSHAAELGRLAG